MKKYLMIPAAALIVALLAAAETNQPPAGALGLVVLKETVVTNKVATYNKDPNKTEFMAGGVTFSTCIGWDSGVQTYEFYRQTNYSIGLASGVVLMTATPLGELIWVEPVAKGIPWTNWNVTPAVGYGVSDKVRFQKAETGPHGWAE